MSDGDLPRASSTKHREVILSMMLTKDFRYRLGSEIG